MQRIIEMNVGTITQINVISRRYSSQISKTHSRHLRKSKVKCRTMLHKRLGGPLAN